MPRPRAIRTDFVCKLCKNVFQRVPSQIKRGNINFCSRRCSDSASTVPLFERFAKYIGERTPSGCILWAGTVQKQTGYGVIQGNERGVIGAHRVAYERRYGPIPEGAHVLHKCDVRMCINPEHLFTGSNLDNIADMISKGRNHKGESASNHVLTEAQVRAIRDEYTYGAASKLAARYGVRPRQIHRIVRRERWAWLK